MMHCGILLFNMPYLCLLLPSLDMSHNLIESNKFDFGSIYWVPTECQYIADSYINLLFASHPNLNELCAKRSKSRLDDL